MHLVVLLLVIFYGIAPVNLLLFEETKIRNTNSQILRTTRFGDLQSGRRGIDSNGDQPTLGNGGKRLICECFHLDAPFNIHFPSPINNKRSWDTFKCSQREPTPLWTSSHFPCNVEIIKSIILTWTFTMSMNKTFFHPFFIFASRFCLDRVPAWL